MSASILVTLMGANSVAMVGASDDPLKLTGRPIAYMLKHGFKGKIFPVNPTRSTVQGLQCHTSLSSIGEKVDLALVATAASSVEAVIEEGIGAGIRNFIVFSSGFAELDDEGYQRQIRLRRIAIEQNVAILGPNCLGVVNSRTGLVASFNTAMERNILLPGAFGFVTQSGALGSYWLDAAIRSGIGFSHWITTGNECNIDAAKALEFLVEDKDTEIIGLYLEDVRDVNALRRGLMNAAGAGKPVLVIKSGSSATGAAAAASHTGALAGNDQLYEACFAQCGAIRVRSISEMLDVARLHTWNCVPTSSRLGAMTVSGGAGVMIADAAEKEGLTVDAFESATSERLAAVLPSFAKPNNPVDLTAAIINDPELLGLTLTALCADKSLGMRVLFIGLLQSIAGQVADSLLAERERSGKSVVVIWFGADRAVVDRLEAAQIPVFTDIPQAVRALGLAWKGQVLRKEVVAPTQLVPLRQTFDQLEISEAKAKRMLDQWDGIRVPHGLVIDRNDLISQLIQKLKPPLVAKLQSPQMKHKSEYGGVVLRIGTHAHAAEVATELAANAARQGLSIEGVLIEEMVPFDFELVLGMKHDAAFGPVMVLGRGGITVEADPDISILLMPVTHHRVRKALLGLRYSVILKGYRGGPSIDLDSCVNSICRLAEQFLAQSDLLELEINPLALRNGDCWALDVIATLESGRSLFAGFDKRTVNVEKTVGKNE